MVNQRNSPLNTKHENNFMGGQVSNGQAQQPTGVQVKGYAKNGGASNGYQPQSSNGFKNFNSPTGGYGGIPHQPIQLKNKKGIRHQAHNYKNQHQSVQITGGEESLGTSLTAHEAATFYSSAMNT